MLQIEEFITKSFTSNTYSAIKNRGIHKASYKLREYLKDVEGTKFCLKLDIRKYYENINHDILKSILRRKIKDRKVLDLLDEIIDSYPQGIPLGNLLSQLFGNLYLNGFDHWLKEIKRVNTYLRYCDDLVILHSDKKYLHRLLAEIRSYLKDILKLEIKSNYQIFPVSSRGIDWCGFVHYHTHTKLRKKIKLNYIKAVKYNKIRSLPSYGGWLKYSNSINLKKKYSFKNGRT